VRERRELRSLLHLRPALSFISERAGLVRERRELRSLLHLRPALSFISEMAGLGG